MNASIDYFEGLHAAADPWGVGSRWYEQRKRALTVASLPAAHYPRALEIGCSVGELTAALAPRCGELIATDASLRAVESAVARTRDLGNVHVLRQQHPREWPSGAFDLVVLSEVGYYLDAGDLRRMALRIVASLAPGGLVVACHWRWPFAERVLATDEVHATLAQTGLADAFVYRDRDFILQGWGGEDVSVAQREGLA